MKVLEGLKSGDSYWYRIKQLSPIKITKKMWDEFMSLEGRGSVYVEGESCFYDGRKVEFLDD